MGSHCSSASASILPTHVSQGQFWPLVCDVLLTIASGKRIHAEHGRAPKRGFAFREAAWEKSECSLTPFASVI